MTEADHRAANKLACSTHCFGSFCARNSIGARRLLFYREIAVFKENVGRAIECRQDEFRQISIMLCWKASVRNA
jgi:hypothetical protein